MIVKSLSNDVFFKLPYTYRKIGNYYFVCSEIGSWILLNEKEFSIFRLYSPQMDISKELLDKLRNHFLLFHPNDFEKKEEIFSILIHKKSNLTKGPDLFYIGVTHACNLKCLYCHLSSCPPQKNKKFNDVILQKMIEFIMLTPNQSITIEFQGGEPLLNFPLIKKTIEVIKNKNKQFKKNIRYCLTTNLIFLNEGILDFFIQENVYLTFTLDGIKSIHDKQRPQRSSKKSSYDATLEKLELLKRKKCPYSILTIVTRNSLGKEKEIVDNILTLGCKTIIINKVQNLGRANETWGKIGITNEEFFLFWKNVVEYIFDLQKQGYIVSERVLNLMLHKLFYNDPNYVNIRNPGGEVISTLGFDSEGYIYPSDEARDISDFRLGNVLKNNYNDILNNSLAKEIFKATILEGQICNYCAYKSFCGTCTDLSYMNTSEFINRPWLQTSRCSLHKAQFDYFLKKVIDEPKTIQGILFVKDYLWKNTRK